MFVADETYTEKWVAKPNFGRSTMFDENSIAVHLKNTTCFQHTC